MKVDVFRSRRRACRGYYVETDGTIWETMIERKDIINSMQATVLWNGKLCELHFWNPINGREINMIASDLILHPGFLIRGRVLVVEEEALFHVIRVEGEPDAVENKIKHLTFLEKPIVAIDPIYVRCSKIYARNEDDAFAARMCV